MYKINEKVVAFLPPDTIEPEALQQILNTSTVPCLYHHVAVMPDTHFGKGSTVGTVLATQGAVIPAAVGVDIGCGMIAVKTSLIASDLEGKLPAIRAGIERRIPMSAGRFNNKITESAAARIKDLEDRQYGWQREEHSKLSPNWREQLGTLGGGNHFIEICVDTEGAVWVTLHSGSRGIGNKIGNLYIKKAQDICEKMFVTLADPDLAFLVEGTTEFDMYISDLKWAQQFALSNREEMLDRVMMEIAEAVTGDYSKFATLEHERINCHHNFTQVERHFGHDVWVTRKGAIQAAVGKLGMIPGSMGTRSYIVEGKGNPMSYNSAPHGAGRRMSRAKAKAAFTMDDFDREMKGIEHRRSEVLLDELPGAYKDIDVVMQNASELVDVRAVLKQILNVKGD